MGELRSGRAAGPQVAILAGDFLLARASVSLAALRNSDVIQLLSQVIEDLVSGEIMQAHPATTAGAGWLRLPKALMQFGPPVSAHM